VDSLAKLGAQRTRVKGTTRHGGQLPVVTAEKRARGDFGWHYEARDGAPLVPRIEYALAWIELPRGVTELSGRLSAEAVIEVPRLGVLRGLHAMPGLRPCPSAFRSVPRSDATLVPGALRLRQQERRPVFQPGGLRALNMG
jgi:hypothetical protein